MPCSTKLSLTLNLMQTWPTWNKLRRSCVSDVEQPSSTLSRCYLYPATQRPSCPAPPPLPRRCRQSTCSLGRGGSLSVTARPTTRSATSTSCRKRPTSSTWWSRYLWMASRKWRSRSSHRLYAPSTSRRRRPSIRRLRRIDR